MHSMRVSKFHRLVRVALSASLLAVTCQTTMAQEPAQLTGQSTGDSQVQETTATGTRDGELLADQVGTGGKLGLGVALGFILPVIAPGIAYFVTGPAPMTAETVRQNSAKGPAYQTGFESGWEKKTRSKKRKALLIGGAVGSVAMLVLASSDTGFYIGSTK